MNISPSSLDNHDADSVVKNLSTNGSSAVEVRGPDDSAGLVVKAPYSSQASLALCHLKLEETNNPTIIFDVIIQTDNGFSFSYRVVLLQELYCLMMQMR